MKLHKTNFPGLYYTILKSGQYTFYAKYRHPLTKESVRKKVLTVNKLSDHNITKAYNISLKLKDKETTYKQVDNLEKEKLYKEKMKEHKRDTSHRALNLWTISLAYHKHIREDRLDKLRNTYHYLSEKEFETDRRVTRKLADLEKEKKKFYNYYVGNDILYDKNKLVDMPIHKIKDSHIEDFMSQMSKRRYAPKTMRNIIDKARAMIYFYNKKYKTTLPNPFATYEYKIEGRKLKRVLDNKALKMLLDRCKNYPVKREIDFNPCVYLSVYLGVITAARKSTILDIQKKDFDLRAGKLYLKNVKVYNREFVVNLNKESVEFFKKVLEDYKQDEYIIRPTPPQRKKEFYKYNQPLKDVPDKVYRIMDELFNGEYLKNRKEHKDNIVSFHTLRRSVATNLADSGVPLYKIKLLLNHKTIQQTEEYLQRTEGDIKEELNSLMIDIFN